MIDAVKNNNTVLVQTGYTDVIIILEKFQYDSLYGVVYEDRLVPN